jgi:hypothetical protein
VIFIINEWFHSQSVQKNEYWNLESKRMNLIQVLFKSMLEIYEPSLFISFKGIKFKIVVIHFLRFQNSANMKNTIHRGWNQLDLISSSKSILLEPIHFTFTSTSFEMLLISKETSQKILGLICIVSIRADLKISQQYSQFPRIIDS